MKSSLYLTAVLLVLAICGTVCLNIYSGNMYKDAYTIETPLYGDPDDAEGVSVTIHAGMDDHLFFDMKRDFGSRPEDQCKMDFYHDTPHRILDDSGYFHITMFDGTGGIYSDSGIKLDDYDDYCMMEPARDLASKAKPGETKRETYNLRDFYDYYRMSVSAFADIGRYFSEDDALIVEDYFKFPIDEDILVSAMVRKDELDRVVEVNVDELDSEGRPYIPDVISVVTEDGVYLIAPNREFGGKAFDLSHLKLGWGIYKISFAEIAASPKGDENDWFSTMDEPIKNLVPLDENIGTFLSLDASPDGSRLMLMMSEGDATYLRVYDSATGELLQRINIMDRVSDYPTLYIDGDILFVKTAPRSFSLLILDEQGMYQKKIETSFVDTSVDDDMDTFSRFFPEEAHMAYDGERLAIVVPGTNYYNDCSYYLSVFDEAGLLYMAKCEPSLTIPPRRGNSAENVMFVDRIIYSKPLTVEVS